MIMFYSGCERPSSLKMMKKTPQASFMFSYVQFDSGRVQAVSKNRCLKWLRRRSCK